MSSNIKLVNWQGIAPSNFTWQADLTTIFGVVFKLMLVPIPMASTWNVGMVYGDPGYSSRISCYIDVRIYNAFGVEVWDSGAVLVNFQNGKNYEFDCVFKQMLEVTGVSGHIITKQLRYDTTFANIPVSSVPQNSQGQVQITVSNDGPTAATMGINFTVKDPNGATVQTVSDQSGYVGPGEDWLFAWYSTILLSLTGTYTIQISILVWTGTEWLEVDQWSGNLCTVAGEPPTESIFSNFVVTYAKL